jgi:uncharacterized protein
MSTVIEQAFPVAAPPDETFALMSDIERVCPCIPGAELIGLREDGAYDVRVGMKMGPMNLSYKGSIVINERDPATRHATLHAKATEQRGQGTADASMSMDVVPGSDGSSEVRVRSEMLVTGRVAQMGRGIMVDVANRMIGDMARTVNATLDAQRAAPSAEAPPVIQAPTPRATTLAWTVLRERIRRALAALRAITRRGRSRP